MCVMRRILRAFARRQSIVRDNEMAVNDHFRHKPQGDYMKPFFANEVGDIY